MKAPKRFPILFLFMLLLFTNLGAQPISPYQGEKAAVEFMRLLPQVNPGLTMNDITETSVLTEHGTVVCFIVHFNNGNYVILSADRRAYPVPGYSVREFSANDPGDQPPAFKEWVRQYCKQIYHSMTNRAEQTEKSRKLWDYLLGESKAGGKIFLSKETGPFLISTWNQGLYYNQMCPEDPSGPGGHCYAGCVATAMGQICYYFRFPRTGTGSYSYEHPTYGLISADFENTAYQWNSMENHLAHQNQTIAELLFHLGVSVDMDYGPDGSGMWNHKAAYSLRTYFKYSPETQYVFRDSTSMDWDSLIVAHLDKKIPLYYAGWSVPNVNGHAFVCDGYQDDYFHFNWGWGGSYDGYFYLDELSPGGSNFNLAQELIINCWPDSLNYDYPYYCTGDDTLYSLNGTFTDGSGPLYDYLYSQECSWLISPQNMQDSVTNIELFFSKLETENNKDIITIFDGPSDQDPVLGIFSGDSLPQQLISSGNKVLVTFQSDSAHQYSGWFINYECTIPLWCSGLYELTDPSGSLSDGSGNFNYHNNSACMWDIAPENATSTTVCFTSFNTEEGKDFVKIFDGQTSELLAEFSGAYSPSEPPPAVTSDHGKLFITFSTNNTGTAEGWEAYYESTITGLKYDDSNKQELVIYPNPAKDIVTIGNVLPESRIEIRNILGEIVLSLPSFPQSGILETNFLDNGLYFLVVKGKSDIKMGKFIISR